MSEFNAQPPGGHANILVEAAGDDLTGAQQATLRHGLSAAPLPRPHTDFNAAVLSAVLSGQDFDMAGGQVKTRLRWAALPALIGFALMYGLACWQARSLPAPPAPYPRVNHGQPAPPLPDLPLFAPPGQAASPNSAGLNGQNDSQLSATSTSHHAVTAGGPRHDR